MRNQWCFGFLCVWQFCDFLCSLVCGAGLPLVFHASVCCVSQGFSHSSNWLSSVFQCCCLRLLASPFGGYGKEGWTVPSINWSGLLWFVLETCECSVAALLYSWQVSLAKKKKTISFITGRTLEQDRAHMVAGFLDWSTYFLGGLWFIVCVKVTSAWPVACEAGFFFKLSMRQKNAGQTVYGKRFLCVP